MDIEFESELKLEGPLSALPWLQRIGAMLLLLGIVAFGMVLPVTLACSLISWSVSPPDGPADATPPLWALPLGGLFVCLFFGFGAYMTHSLIGAFFDGPISAGRRTRMLTGTIFIGVVVIWLAGGLKHVALVAFLAPFVLFPLGILLCHLQTGLAGVGAIVGFFLGMRYASQWGFDGAVIQSVAGGIGSALCGGVCGAIDWACSRAFALIRFPISSCTDAPISNAPRSNGSMSSDSARDGARSAEHLGPMWQWSSAARPRPYHFISWAGSDSEYSPLITSPLSAGWSACTTSRTALQLTHLRCARLR